MPRVVHTGDEDAVVAKKDLSCRCPFCTFTGRSDNVRRHIQRNHTDIKALVGKRLANNTTFHVLDAEHPGIVITHIPKGDVWYANQAYCFGCHHRIMCLSKNADKAAAECCTHTCTEKQTRSTSSSETSSVATTKSAVADTLDWKTALMTMANKRPAIKKCLDDTLADYDDEDDMDWEEIGGSTFNLLNSTVLAAAKNAERQAAIIEEVKQTARQQAYDSCQESHQRQLTAMEDNHQTQIAALQQQIQFQKSQIAKMEESCPE
jgi:hypothetical protein